MTTAVRPGAGREPRPAAERDRAGSRDAELAGVADRRCWRRPRGRPAPSCAAMAALAREAGHPVAWHEPRLGGAAVARSVRALAGELSGVDQLVVGDPFSGVMQVIITISRGPPRSSIVDDGTATLEFARQWVSGEHLSRWHQVATPEPAAADLRPGPGPDRRRAYAVGCRRRRAAGCGCSPACRSTCPASTSAQRLRLGARRVRPAGRQARRRPGRHLAGRVRRGRAPRPTSPAWPAWPPRHGVDRYFAHRKEADGKLDQIDRLGIEVVRPALPLEIVARRGPVGRPMLSFPSTVVHTLPLVLAGTGGAGRGLRRSPTAGITRRPTLQADDVPRPGRPTPPAAATAWPRWPADGGRSSTGSGRAIIPARGGSKGVPGQEPAPGGRGEPGRAGGPRLPGGPARSTRSTSAPTTPTSPTPPSTAGAEVIIRPRRAGRRHRYLGVGAAARAGPARPRRRRPRGRWSSSSAPARSSIRPTSTAAVALVADGQADSAFAAVATHEFLWRSRRDQRRPWSTGQNHDAAYRPRRQDRGPTIARPAPSTCMRRAGFRAARHRFFGRTAPVAVPDADRGGDRHPRGPGAGRGAGRG